MSNQREFASEIERKIVQDYEAGARTKDIMAETGCGGRHMYRVLSRHGVALREVTAPMTMDKVRDVCPSVAAAMEERGFDIGDLADKVGYCEGYVRRVLVGSGAMSGIFALFVAQALGINHAQIKKEADLWWRRNKPNERRKIRRLYEVEMSDEMIEGIVADYRDGNEPVNAIAQKWGISASRVTIFARRAGCKGRYKKGRSGLTDETRNAILADYKAGVKVGIICAKYDVSQNRMYEVVKTSGCKMRYRTSPKE